MSWLKDLFGKGQVTTKSLAGRVVEFEKKQALFEDDLRRAQTLLAESEKKALLGSGSSKQVKELREQVSESSGMVEACRGVIEDLRVELLESLGRDRSRRLEEIQREKEGLSASIPEARRRFVNTMARAAVEQVILRGIGIPGTPIWVKGPTFFDHSELELFRAELDRLMQERGIAKEHIGLTGSFQRLDSEEGILRRQTIRIADVNRVIEEARTQTSASTEQAA